MKYEYAYLQSVSSIQCTLKNVKCERIIFHTVHILRVYSASYEHMRTVLVQVLEYMDIHDTYMQ